eukprot:gene3872-4127_t
MSLQPVEPPLYNRKYNFSFAPRTSASSDGLLRMVEPVEVMVELLRCTLGQVMTYNQWLAQLITHDSTTGPFMLLDNGERSVSYSELLEGFHKIQCNPGYTGMLCGSCDAEYEETLSNSSTVKRRFALSLNKCIDCAHSPATTAFVLFLLFLLFFGYVGLGIFGQVKAEQASLTSLAQHQAARGSSQQEQRHSTTSAASTASPSAEQDENHNATAAQGPHKHFTQPSDEQQQALQSSDDAREHPHQQPVCEQPDTQQAPQLQQPVPVAGPPAVACQSARSSGMQKAEAAHAANTKPQGAERSQGKAGAVRPATVAVLVAMWKVMTSYVQVLAMVRFLPAIRELSGQVLSIADLSSTFTQFGAFDCMLPGPADKLAYIRILLAALGVPVLLFLSFVLAPQKLRKFLPLRLLISLVVVAYSCYPLFTSNMLLTLACQPVDGALPGGRFSGVTGLYWKQDYRVQCFHGAHAALAGFGAAMLVIVGVILPLVLGVQLWRNRGRLREPEFALKYSFLYREYEDNLCFWEFVIMARKLAFLGVFVALTPPHLLMAEFVALLQLVVVVMVAVIALLVQEVLQPFKDQRLNTLERAGLMSNIMTFLMLAAAVAISGNHAGRVVLLVLTGVLNLGMLCYFFWHMGTVIWALAGPGLKSMMQCKREAWDKQWQAWRHNVTKSKAGQAMHSWLQQL